ncbi:Chromatin remodeling factor mit1 [Termitomyces sp. J132]|nr:Chromatin remodeling factor mit1 [Termitomyces sp. J132]
MLLDEVIGHYREHDISYYYARYQGGLAHKFFSTPFLRKFKHLVDEFNRKDAAGELEPFDPSAHYIHPSSRVKFTVSINNRRATVNISSARSIKSVSGLETVPDSEEEKRTDVDDESDNDESDFEEEEQSFRRRTSGQVSVTRKQTLPFSPKKTRSARVFVIDSDLETGASDKNVTIIPTRRSSRNTKRNRKELKDLDSDDSDADLICYSDADAYAPRTPHTKAKPKKLMGKRESRPAYGHFRSIADLDYDSHSDEETAPMRKHRNICEKCHQPPAHKFLKALSRSKKKKTEDEFEESGDEEEKLAGLDGWVRCLKCSVVAHWKCMASVQREEILKAARDRERAEWERNQSHDGDLTPEPAKRSGLTPDQTAEFICGACMKGGFCMFCMEVALEADSVQKEKACSAIKDKATTDDPKENSTLPQSSASENTTDGYCSTKQLLFRCLTCKRLAHYAHLLPSSHNPSKETIAEIAQHYTQTWLCADCASYTFGVDRVIVWRPYPPTVVEPTRDETTYYKYFLPREYLVKWIDRSFRRVQWVPHMWLLSTHPAKLKHFLMGDGLEDDLDEDIQEERELAFDRGEQPSDNLVETVSDWETRTGYTLSEENIRQIAWAFIKWEDLGYDEASWDSPPRPNDPTYPAFESALRRYVHSRGVVVPKHSMSHCEKFDKRAKDQYRTRHALKYAADLDIGQDQQLKLMPFQVDGFNWLCNNWWNLQPCILGDEMGLGKTVQVATFLGSIVAKFKAFPALVVVPNSTITNWVREFERWAPDLRVVPFYDQTHARTGAKFHVLIATYEALLNPKDFTPVFSNQPQLEVLIIDEGQRLKSDSSLLFKRLNELKSIQRILMTGTPLNNNIRELFNLMNFLDPNEWNDLEGLEK